MITNNVTLIIKGSSCLTMIITNTKKKNILSSRENIFLVKPEVLKEILSKYDYISEMKYIRRNC